MTGYTDRADAGTVLAGLLQRYRDRTDVLVLGLPRGGVPVAAEVAGSLRAPLDVLVVRKIGVPGQPEVAMGAIAAIAGTIEIVENEELTAELRRRKLLGDAFDETAARERAELRRREHAYRAGREPLRVAGMTLILVDDGIATGASMRAAVVAARQQNPARIVVAAPVGASDACEALEQLADEVVCPWMPADFMAVGQAYRVFDQTSDDEVRSALDSA